MHLYRTLLYAVGIYLCISSAAGREGVLDQQYGNAIAPRDGPKPTSSNKHSSPGHTDKAQKKGDGHSTDKHAHMTTTISHRKSTSPARNETQLEKSEELPIQPSITPAIGIAGIVLLLSGAAFCIIGIRHEWFHILLGSAYAASLGVTVLIIYVMSPPVSDAIQGAYFVAALSTGAVFGGLALIFKDITRGFGCLVGGFCLAMWILCLKPGGLITSTIGKAILIGVFTVVAWATSFSQYTRNYGIIGCTAFAGAMIAIIGIDCFSRAGLKEFWIYIWDLNSNEFPLHTDTYPITRGMRAELACTIIIAICGVVSQLKLWKVVKERKAKKEEERLQEQARRDQRDSQYGRAIETNNEMSLATWEAVYGDKQHGGGSTNTDASSSVNNWKKSASVKEREVGPFELTEVTAMGSRAAYAGRSDKALINESPQRMVGPGTEREHNGDGSRQNSNDFEQNYNGRYMRTAADPSGSSASSQAGLISPASEADVRTPYQLRATPDLGNREVTNRDMPSESVHDWDAFGITRVDDDGASSIAATADEDPDFDALSVKRFSMYSHAAPRESAEIPPVPALNAEDHVTTDNPVKSTEPGEGSVEATPAGNDSDGAAVHDMDAAQTASVSGRSDQAAKEGSQAARELNESNLPRSISRVAMVYRTNEWAKHIAEADQPADHEEAPSDEPAVQVDVERPVDDGAPLAGADSTEEIPRPVDVRALSPMQMPPPVFRSASTLQRANSPGDQRGQVRSSSRAHASQLPPNSFARHQSAIMRSQSQPMLQQSQVEPLAPSTPTDDSNLMDERNVRLSNKPSTVNFNQIRSFSPLPALRPTSPPLNAQAQDGGEIVRGVSPLIDGRVTPQQSQPAEETLRHRASLLKRPSSSLDINNQPVLHDSHQPKRSNTIDPNRQSAMHTQWRQSLQQDTALNGLVRQNSANLVAERDRARQSMMHQMQHRNSVQFREEEQKKKRESQMERAMRTTDLADRHQNALRKMQAQAHKG